MPENTQLAILERGHVYFFYRPKVQEFAAEDEKIPHALQDIQRFYMVLHPDKQKDYRLILLGHKRLPEPEAHSKYWAVVDMVTQNPEELKDALKQEVYTTKTQGKRQQPAARACGEGVYCIAQAGGNTYFAYQLTFPKEPQEVQEAFNLGPEGSYIIAVKNQKIAGTTGGKTADFPTRLQNKFHSLRFMPVDPPEFLNYTGAELIIIGASSQVAKELNISLIDSIHEAAHPEIFKELKLWQSEHITKPLFAGKWS